jgi:hypothetical protein
VLQALIALFLFLFLWKLQQEVSSFSLHFSYNIVAVNSSIPFVLFLNAIELKAQELAG